MKRIMIAVAMVIALDPSVSTAGDDQLYRIAIAKSAIREVPQDLLPFAGDSLQELMKARTGLNGKVTLDHEWSALVRNLNDGELELGVLQGHEYAWAKQKYPDLQALVCSIERPKEVMAYLLVRHDCKAANLTDLKGGKLVLATTLKDHARLFLEKRQGVEMGKESFGTVAKTDTVHEAIHKVIAEEFDVTAADHASWNYFQKLYPGAAKNLKVIAKSEEFPSAVLVYKKGHVDEVALKKLRDGLVSAHETTKGARMMAMMRIEKFVDVPDSFEATVATCLKAYPTPRAEK